MRYEPAIVEARALIGEGAIGELRHGRTGASWQLSRPETAHVLAVARRIGGRRRHARPGRAPDRRVAFPARRASAPLGLGSDGGGESVRSGWRRGARGRGRLVLGRARVRRRRTRDGGGVADLPGRRGRPVRAVRYRRSLVGNLDGGRLALRRFDGREAAYREIACADPFVRAVEALRPPARLSLGSFVDLHAAALHHVLARVAGNDPAPGLAPTLQDAAAAESIAHQIVRVGGHTPPLVAAGSPSSPRSPNA